MNKIFKVIYSKVRNCYVVTSEFAKANTKSSTGSERNRTGRKALLTLAIAAGIFCGGLGVATAADGTVHVADIEATTTSKEVYTAGKVDTLLADYGKKSDVENNKNSITTMNTTITTQGQSIATNVANIANNTKAIEKKIDTEMANERFAAKVDLTALQNQVTGKVDKNTFEEALNQKADTDLGNLTEEGKTAIKNTISEDMDLKADKTYVDTEVGKKADKATTLAGYGIGDAYTKDATDTAITTKVNEEKNDRELKDTELSGRIDTLSTTVNSKVSKTDLNTTLGNYYTQAETNAAIKTAVDDEKNARETAIKGEVTDRNKAISDAIALEVTNRDAAITKAKMELQEKVTAEETARKAEDAKLEGKITENTTAINNEKVAREAEDTALSERIGTVDANGNYIQKSATNNVSENLKVLDKQAKTNADAIAQETADRKAAIGELAVDGNYIEKDKNVSDNLVKLDEQAKANADEIVKTNERTDGIARNTEKTKTTIEGKVTVDNSGNVGGVKNLSAETIETTGNATIGGALNVTGASDLKGNVTLGTNAANTVTVNGKSDFKEAVEMDKGLTVTSGDTTLQKTNVNGALNVSGESNLKNTTVDGTLSVNKETTLNDKLTAKGEATFKENVTMEKDLEVKGELKTDKIAMENKKTDADGTRHNSATTITADGITHIGEVEKSGVITKSQFTHTEKGSETYAKKGDTADWTETRSDVKADGVKTEVKDSKGNRTNTSQTTEGINGYATDKAGNKTYTKVTATENSFQVQDKDGKNKNHQVNTMDSSVTEIKNDEGKTTKTEQTAENITNTAKDGTIKNDAKDIVNNASGNISNKSQTMDTIVTGKATESYGSLDTTVNGQATENYKGGLNTTVTGAENHTVTGKQTNTVESGQENIISGGQINNITGDQTTIISGTQTTTATDINRNASSSMVDKVDNAYGTNTETKEAGKTTTDVSIQGTGEKGQYIRGANESRDYLTKGTLTNSETKTAGATSTEITDGTNKASTIQDAKNLAGSVTNDTETGVSGIHANDDGSVSIDSAVVGGSSISTINQKKDSITSQVTDGTTITKTEQGAKDITNTAKDGTITNDAKDIVNNAGGNMTNTVGGNQTNTIGGNQTTTVTGDILNTAKNITNEASNSITDKVGDHTRVLNRDGITDTVGGSTFKQRIDAIMMESKDVSIKAEETLTNEAKVITNKASEVINNEAVNINNTATGIITSKASEIKNQADKLISNKVGENTWENMENGKITTSIKDGAKQNLTQSDAAGTTQSTVDGGKSTVTIQNADGLADAVTDGTNTSVQNQTASAIAAAVKDGAGNENASVATATTSANTIKSGSKANTVISTADGTSFINSDAMTPVTGASGAGTAVNTTIKGNTITTGKVTMDYADVMKDLGVRGNANITGKTTTGSLEVTGTSTLKGDVTMGSNATVNGNFTVNGTTNLKNTNVVGKLDVTQEATFHDSVSIAKDLSVGGDATIAGDVTAKSYKVGGNTYIDSNGINANDQKITNVADGSISEGSKDAVNGGQLFETNRRIDQFDSRINEVGANAAAMANLHPMEFDADSKLNVAVGVGNYRNKTATAMGLFYRPNEDVMFNVSSTIGSNDNMVGGGISFRLGSGGNKEKTKALAQAAEQNKQLKSQVDTLQAQMDALLSVINPNMSKDFPDVPNNHWAYEAVSRLAGNDIIQGYEDGKYHGERTMTRYEMAVIIYKALQKGAKAEAKLVEEFKPELKAIAAHEKA